MTTLFPRTKLVVLLLLTSTSGCRTAGSAGDAAEALRGEPLEFERLQVGSVYGIGSRFESDDLKFVVDGFGEGLGNAEVARAVEAASGKPSKDAGAKTLRLSHATLRCQAPGVKHLEFDFVDNGGPVALEIAGVVRAVANFIQLDGVQMGSVRIAVSESSTAGIRHGRVVLRGALSKFAIAGAELEVADLRLSRDD